MPGTCISCGSGCFSCDSEGNMSCDKCGAVNYIGAPSLDQYPQKNSITNAIDGED